MSEVKHPKIKLFGKTIELPETVEAAEICEPAAQSCDAAKEDSSNQKPTCSSNYSVLEDSDFNGDAEDQESHQSQSCPKQDNAKDENQPHHSSSNELKDYIAPPPLVDDSKEDSSNSQDKTLKKPDKILPCPRCNSTDTKFCYFNNYNVNQPRHFCKKCQRYWTAGGIMRNVPVGAGRRKNKNVLASQFRPLTVPQAARVSVLNIADKTIGSKEINGDDCSSGSSISSSKDEVPVFCGAPWPYPWQNSVQWSSQIAPPTFTPTSFPVPFYTTTPPPYWAGPSIWNVPFVISPTPTLSSGPNSPTLGKHLRDENILKPANSEDEEMQKKSNNSEKCLWVPKTLRIDDPGEASKSSIWGTLGIKNDIRDDDCVGVGGGLFKAFQSQSKDDEKNRVQESSTVLQANPAALSRSVSFRESP